jgi:hypothetical protein
MMDFSLDKGRATGGRCLEDGEEVTGKHGRLESYFEKKGGEKLV